MSCAITSVTYIAEAVAVAAVAPDQCTVVGGVVEGVGIVGLEEQDTLVRVAEEQDTLVRVAEEQDTLVARAEAGHTAAAVGVAGTQPAAGHTAAVAGQGDSAEVGHTVEDRTGKLVDDTAVVGTQGAAV